MKKLCVLLLSLLIISEIKSFSQTYNVDFISNTATSSPSTNTTGTNTSTTGNQTEVTGTNTYMVTVCKGSTDPYWVYDWTQQSGVLTPLIQISFDGVNYQVVYGCSQCAWCSGSDGQACFIAHKDLIQVGPILASIPSQWIEDPAWQFHLAWTDGNYNKAKLTYNLPFTRKTWVQIFARWIDTGGAFQQQWYGTYIVDVYPSLTQGILGSSQTACVDKTNAFQPLSVSSDPTTGGCTNGTTTYAWQTSPNGSSPWTTLSGQTSDTYTFPSTNTVGNVYYQRVVNTLCNENVASNSVLIKTLPAINPGTISSPQTICNGNTPSTLTAITTPTGGDGNFTYTWEYTDNPNNNSWHAETPSNSEPFSPGPVTASTYYNVQVNEANSAYGCQTKTSNNVQITVNPGLTVGSISPPSNVCYNTVPSPIICTAPTGGDGNYTYQWLQYNNGTWQNAPGGTNSLTYQPGSLTTTEQYELKVTTCGQSLYTAPVTIGVYEPFVAGTIGSNQTITNGGTPNDLTGTDPTGGVLNGGQGTYTYQWYYSFDNTNWFPCLDNGNSSAYHFSNGLTTTTYYRRSANVNSCGPVYTNTVKITVSGALTEGTLNGAQTLCYNSTSATALYVTNGPSGGSGNYSYQWEYSTDNVQWNNCTGDNYNASQYTPTGLTTTTYYRRQLTDIGFTPNPPPVYTNSIKITVYAKLNAPAISVNQNIANGTAPNPISCGVASGGDNNFTYQWYSASDTLLAPTLMQGSTSRTITPGNLVNTMYYRVIATSTSCGSISSAWCQIYVNPVLQAGQVTGTQTICYNTIPTQQLYCSPSNGGTGNAQYQWQSSTDGANFFDIPGITANAYTPATPLTSTTYYRVKITAGNVAYTNVVTVTVLSRINSGQVGVSQTICSGSSPNALNFTTNSTGGSGNYTYQWQSSSDNLSSNFQDCGGEGNNSFSFIPDPLVTTTYFRCQVSDLMCTSTILTTNSVQITVQGALYEGVQTSLAQSICYNAVPSVMSVSSPSGGNGPNSYTYQWQNSTDNFSFTNIVNATSPTYTPTNGLTQTTYFRRSVTSGSCGTAYSASITVTVLPELTAPEITGDQTICYNTTPAQAISISLAPTGGNGQSSYSYQWQKSTNGVIFTSIAGSSEDSYQPPSLNTTTAYRVFVTSGACGSATSNTATITVPGPLQEATISQSQTICFNSVPQILTGNNATGGDDTYSYQWQSSHDNQTWVDISGAVGLSFQSGSLMTDTFYRRTVSSFLCGTANSNGIKITVGTPVNAGMISSSEHICSGNIPAILKGTSPSGGNGLFSYVWQSSPDSVVFYNISNGTNSTMALGALITTTYYRRIVNSSCGSDTTNVIGIYVLPAMTPGSVVSPQSLCYGVVPDKLSGSTPTGGSQVYSYMWQWSSDNNLFVNVDSLGTSSTYVPPPAKANVYYRRMAYSSSCTPSASNSIYISVLPAINPATLSNNQTICYNSKPIQLTGAAASGGMGSYTYQWYASNIVDTIWSYIPGETSLNYQPQNLINTSYYKRIASSGACGSATSNILTINVYPNVKPGVISGTQTICYNSIPNVLTDSISPTGGSGAYLYQWQSSADKNKWTNISNANAPDYLPGYLTSGQYYRLIIGNYCDTVTTNNITVKVLPALMGGQITGEQSICYNMTPLTIKGSSAIGADGNYTYQWQQSLDSINWNDLFFNGTGLNYSPDSLQQTTYYQRVASSVLCNNTTSSSNVIKVTVSPLPLAGAIKTSQTICNNTVPDKFSGTQSLGGTGDPIYTWQYSTDGTTWNNIYFSGDSLDYSPAQLTVSTLFRRQTSMQGCNPIYTNNVTVTVFPAIPKPQLSVDSVYCKNSVIKLSATDSTTKAIVWFNSNGTVIKQGLTLEIDTFTHSRVLSLKAFGKNGCPSDSVIITLKLDSVQAAFSQGLTSVIAGNAINFENQSINGKTYVWDFFDGDPSFEKNPWHFYNNPGLFNVKLTATTLHNCSDSIMKAGLIIVEQETGISNATSHGLQVYPNPVTDYLYVKSNGEDIQSVLISNISGQALISKEYEGIDNFTINVSFLPSGVYIVEIKTNNNIHIFKVIKQ